MSNVRHLTALALARAMLAGPQQAHGMAARMRQCLGQPAASWPAEVAERLARVPGEQWRRLDVRWLAQLLQRQPAWHTAWLADQRPRARRYILRPPTQLQRAPLGLDQVPLPRWVHLGALAQGLDLGDGGLWRLTLPAGWQRRRPLVEQHYLHRILAKPAGGHRLLEVPQPHLMAVQRRLLRELLNLLPVHEAAQAYVRGRGLRGHAAAHAGQAVLLKFDLRDFFASVHASRVHALFATLGYSEVVARALTGLCTVASPEPVLQRLRGLGALSFEQVQRLRDAHLPQGAPTSPALANLCAFRLDLRLAGLAQVLGARYTRYADDLVFSGGTQLVRVRERVRRWVARIAAEEGFALHHGKTRCAGAGQRRTVCGVVVNERPNLPRDEFDRLKAVLHQCVLHGPASQNRGSLPHWRQHLEGRVAWAAHLNPTKAQRLHRLLQAIRWDPAG